MLFVFLLVTILLWVGIRSAFGPGSKYQFNRVKKEFSANTDNLQTVKAYTEKIDPRFHVFYFSAKEGPQLFDSVKLKSTPIEDASCAAAIKELRAAGYDVIFGNSSYVMIQREKGLADDAGIIFFFDESSVLDIAEKKTITELFRISEDGWYYYVGNYEAWQHGNKPDVKIISVVSSFGGYLKNKYKSYMTQILCSIL